MVRLVASLNSPVLLLGETGVGKEVIANAIHYSSPRKDGPFIKVNCGAIPDTLIDSELFGHEEGAFTGATTKKRGRFERAHKGTILLDEIGELPPPAQIRLLRVIQNKEVERVGGTKPIPVDIRVIAATHRNLKEMVSKNEFREDLWFRLNVFPITIPPLRERKEDIHALVQHFAERKSKELKFHTVPTLATGAIDRLKSYHWPGNVRELENVVERALIQKSQDMAATLGIKFNASGISRPVESLQGDAETVMPWRKCYRPVTLMYITSNGNVLPCCISPFSSVDYPSIILGNVFKNPLEEIWRGLRYHNFRKRHRTKTPPACCRGCGLQWSL